MSARWLERIGRDGVALHVERGGVRGGPPVVLLHGFPEAWYGWAAQLEALAAAGCDVAVPDQRGYGRSDRPAGVAAYALDELVADVAHLARTLFDGPILLAGHDWGAAVAWMVALRHPELLARLAILNVPHPLVMERTLRRDLAQMLRSHYIAVFQLPWLPERLLSAWDHALPARTLRRSAAPGVFDGQALAPYKADWSRPGAWTAMLNWYRAVVRHRPRLGDPVVSVPTRILWGQRDRFLGAAMGPASLELCREGRLVPFPRASHWLQHEQPDAVSDQLLDLARGAAP